MPFIQVNGARLYYETYGRPQPGRAPIVLIHGSYITGRVDWGEVAPLLQTCIPQAANAYVSPDLVERIPRKLDPDRVAREGAGRERDTLPRRLFDEPLKGGASDGVAVTREELEAAMDDYYGLCGWDRANGKPTQAKLEELGLGWIA